MRVLTKSFISVFAILAATAVGVALRPQAATAQALRQNQNQQQPQPKPQSAPTPTKPATPPAAQAAQTMYKYAAKAGDSYTVLARKAIQTYGITDKVKLSQAQIIFAETNLMLEGGAPRLAVGQQVALPKASVKKWVDAAQKLTPAQIAAWQYYVAFVDFNTNNAGTPIN